MNGRANDDWMDFLDANPRKRAEMKLRIKYCTEQINGCLIWKGSISYTGSPKRGPQARTSVNHKYVLIPRIVWYLNNGRIPKGKFVCHSCDNPLCANIDHLWLGTNRENQLDSVQKGRSRNR